MGDGSHGRPPSPLPRTKKHTLSDWHVLLEVTPELPDPLVSLTDAHVLRSATVCATSNVLSPSVSVTSATRQATTLS